MTDLDAPVPGAPDGTATRDADLALVHHICGCLSSLISGLEPDEDVIFEVQGAAAVWEKRLWPALERLGATAAAQAVHEQHFGLAASGVGGEPR